MRASVIARPELVATEEAAEPGLDAGVLRRVAQLGGLAGPPRHDLGAAAGDVSGGLDAGRGDEAAGQRPALQQARQPVRAGETGLRPGTLVT